MSKLSITILGVWATYLTMKLGASYLTNILKNEFGSTAVANKNRFGHINIKQKYL